MSLFSLLIVALAVSTAAAAETCIGPTADGNHITCTGPGTHCCGSSLDQKCCKDTDIWSIVVGSIVGVAVVIGICYACVKCCQCWWAQPHWQHLLSRTTIVDARPVYISSPHQHVPAHQVSYHNLGHSTGHSGPSHGHASAVPLYGHGHANCNYENDAPPSYQSVHKHH